MNAFYFSKGLTVIIIQYFKFWLNCATLDYLLVINITTFSRFFSTVASGSITKLA